MSRIETAFDRTREGAFHFARGDYEGSVRHFSLAVESDPACHVAFLSRGAAYVKLDRNEEAIRDFETAVALKPGDAKSHHFLGLAYMQRGDRAAADREFDRAIEIDPRYGVAYFSRGTNRSEMGEVDRAGSDMKTAARLGEANLQNFADSHNIWRTRYDKVMAEIEGERERDVAVKPDLTAWVGE